MNLPDSPNIPRLLTTLNLILSPLEFFDKMSEHYGDAFTLGNRNNSPTVYFSHPQAIKEIFTANPDIFESATPIHVETIVGKNSLAIIDGERHRRQRRLLMPPFHGERMHTYGQLICEITNEVIEKWKVDQIFPIRSVMQEITLRIILQVVFGLNKGDRYEQLRTMLGSFLDTVGSTQKASLLFFPALRWDLGSWSPWGKFIRLRQQIDELLYNEIQERRKSIDSSHNDILSLLMMARDEADQPLTDIELRDQLLTLLFAGHETTASALALAIYWIHYLPEVKSNLSRELKPFRHEADPLAIAKLPYLKAVCQETLRLHPVAFQTNPRRLKEPFKIMSYELASGTTLVGLTYLTHKREDLYPQSKKFQPKRFIERQYAPYEYFPFGGGNRSCIGMAFAQFEMKLVLATILSRWQLSLVKHDPIKLVRHTVALAPPNSLRMIVTGKT
jgi:cytochrome P450 family 110